MAKRLTGQNPLAYIGVEPLTPPNSVESERNPLPTDIKGFNIGDMWINTATDQGWVLTSKDRDGVTWTEMSSGIPGASSFPTDVGTAVANMTVLDIKGGSLITTDALTPNTVTVSLDNGTDGQIIIGATAGSPTYGNLTSTGGTITISEGPNTLNIEADTTGFAENYPTDSGTAQPMGGDLNIIGGGNLNTEGSGNTVTVNITNGTDGQVLIGGGSDAQWGHITSLGGTITVTNGANTINIESTTDGTNTFTTDSGTATQSLNNIDVVGANVISTSGSGDTVTVSLDNGTNGQLLIGGGANPVWANLTSSGATVTITNGVNSINLEATGGGSSGASTFHTDGADALESLGTITMAGGNVITTSGAGSTVTFNLDNGTNGQLLIGGGANPLWKNLTSSGATVTITNGPNSINLEATGGGSSGASAFVTNSGTANESLGTIQILGGININTTGSGDTVTVSLDSDITINDATINNALITTGPVTFGAPAFDDGVMQVNGGNLFSNNGTNGEILIGGSTNPQWANITSTDASVVITNGINSIDLSVPGGGGGSSTITQFTSSGTWTKSAGTNFVTVIGWHGGGGGASGGKGTLGSNSGGGGGGGNGSSFYFTIPAVFCGATEPVVIGTGGTGGAAVTLANTPGNDGNPGTESYFGNIRIPVISNEGSAARIPTQFLGGQAGFVYTSFNSLQTFVASGETAPFRPTSLVPGPNSSNSVISRSGGNGSNNGSGNAAFILGGNPVGSIYFSYKTISAGGGGGGGATGFSGGAGSALTALNGVTNLIPGATAGAAGANKPTSGGMIVGGMGGGGGNGHATTPQNGGNGGFPGGGGGGGGMGGNAAASSGAGGNGGDGLIIVIEW